MKQKRIMLIILIISLALAAPSFAETAESQAAYTSAEGFAYTLPDAENGTGVLAVPETEGEILTVPAAMDGNPVKSLDAGCIPENVTTVFLPAGAELGNRDALKHEIRLYSYKDYEMIHNQKSIMYFEAAVEPGEYALTDAKRILPGAEDEILKQEYYEYPKELNGRRLYNGLTKNDYYILYRGNGCDYYKVSESEAGVCNYLGAGKTIEIPDQIDGMTVVEINSLTSEWAIFSGKTRKVIFPDTLKKIGNFVVFTKMVSSIRIPDGVEEIGSYAIKGDAITSITIPASVKTIGVRAFDIRMKALKLPATIEKIPERAFTNSNYTSITLPEGMEAIPRELCLNSLKLGKVVIPASVTRIGENAFAKCEKLSSVTIPAEVAEIAAGAFSGCTNLNKITYKGDLIRKIGDETFAGCGFNKPVFPAGTEEIGRRAFAANARMTGAEIPESVTAIGEGAFADCKKLKSVVLTANVQVIADDAFENCANNIVFTVPDESYAKQWAESKGFSIKIAKQKK